MNRRVKGAVLCGGKGVRLRPLTYYFQKAMVPIGSRQKPLLEYVVRLLKYHGVRDVVLLVNYKAEQIVNYFDDGSRFGVRIEYVWDDPSFKGNGGALYNAYRRGFFKDFSDVLIYYGDIITDLDISSLLTRHFESNAVATLALSTSYTVSVGVAEVEGTRVTGLVEKPPLGKPVVIGVLALRVSALDYLESIVLERGGADLIADFIPMLIDYGQRVEAYLTDTFWYDVGSTERYEKLDPQIVDDKLGFLL